MKPEIKRFIVRKYIMAASAEEAIKKDKRSPVSDVWVDDEWMKESTRKEIAGFSTK